MQTKNQNRYNNTNFLTSLPNWLPNLLTLNLKQEVLRFGIEFSFKLYVVALHFAL